MTLYQFIKSIVTFFEPGAENEFAEFEDFVKKFFGGNT